MCVLFHSIDSTNKSTLENKALKGDENAPDVGTFPFQSTLRFKEEGLASCGGQKDLCQSHSTSSRKTPS
ncbi:MAG: hypothetical protein ACP5F6_00635 [Microbacter sp.]